MAAAVLLAKRHLQTRPTNMTRFPVALPTSCFQEWLQLPLVPNSASHKQKKILQLFRLWIPQHERPIAPIDRFDRLDGPTGMIGNLDYLLLFVG